MPPPPRKTISAKSIIELKDTHVHLFFSGERLQGKGSEVFRMLEDIDRTLPGK